MGLALEQNVKNFTTKHCSLGCLTMAYEKNKAKGSEVPYLAGLMTGLASFLRHQGHDRDEVNQGIDIALHQITDDVWSEESLHQEINK